MTRGKIDHPFLVPEGFFDKMENEFLAKMEDETIQNRKKNIFIQVLKYAAIITIAVFLGRQSARLFPLERNGAAGKETISVDLVLSQVSDEEITEYIIDNVNYDVFTKTKSE